MLFPTKLCAVQIATPVEVWVEFTESKDFTTLKRFYQASCSPKTQKRKKLTPPPKECWFRALSRACELWMMLRDCDKCDAHCTSAYTEQKYLVLMEQKYVELLSQPLWTAVSFLMKGTYYIENGIQLTRMMTEEPNQFLLHATIGSIPACKTYGSYRQFALVFHRVLSIHRDQLSVPGPVDGQLPLHVAASNKGRFLQETLRVSDRLTLEEHMFKMIVDASPRCAASTHDAKCMYPLQLACQNGHLWQHGLGRLVEISPTELGSAGIILACSTSRKVGLDRTTSAPRHTWRLGRTRAEKKGTRDCRVSQQRSIVSDKECYFESAQGQIDSLEAVFQLISADPASMFHTLRVPLESRHNSLATR
jgi:hypothetical protein